MGPNSFLLLGPALPRVLDGAAIEELVLARKDKDQLIPEKASRPKQRTGRLVTITQRVTIPKSPQRRTRFQLPVSPAEPTSSASTSSESDGSNECSIMSLKGTLLRLLLPPHHRLHPLGSLPGGKENCARLCSCGVGLNRFRIDQNVLFQIQRQSKQKNVDISTELPSDNMARQLSIIPR